MKTCIKCGKEKDDSEFNKGCGSKCKACKNEYQKQYDIAHKEERMQYRKIYKKVNKEKEKEWRRKYREKNADKVKEQSRKYREKNADKARERAREYYKNNREKINAKNLEKNRGMNEQDWKEKKELDKMDREMYAILVREKELARNRERSRMRYLEKAEEIKAYHAKYRKENGEKIREYNKIYQPIYHERTELINSAKGKLKRAGINPDENKELLESVMLQTRLKRVVKSIKSHKEVTNG